MVITKTKFKCKLCNNTKNFYIMPLKTKVKSGSFINSTDTYVMQCKKCGKNYILEIKIKAV